MSSLSKKFNCKGTLRQVYICLRPPPLLGFGLGWSRNFVGSESGHIQRVWSPTGLHTPHSLPVAHCLYCDAGKGKGRVEPERRLEGQQFTKLGRKYQHDCMRHVFKL
jgi:hypothetical protein